MVAWNVKILEPRLCHESPNRLKLRVVGGEVCSMLGCHRSNSDQMTRPTFDHVR